MGKHPWMAEIPGHRNTREGEQKCQEFTFMCLVTSRPRWDPAGSEDEQGMRPPASPKRNLSLIFKKESQLAL